MGLILPSKKLLMSQGLAVPRPQDVFATSLYTTTGVLQKIQNDLNLAAGGLVLESARSTPTGPHLVDTVRSSKILYTYDIPAESDYSGRFEFLSDGYRTNPVASGASHVGWSFKKAKKFLDIVSYSGSASNVVVPHNLKSTPGLIIIKTRSSTGHWLVKHKDFLDNQYIYLDDELSVFSQSDIILSYDKNSVVLAGNGPAAIESTSYVMYLFAQEPKLIDCGSYTGNGAVAGTEGALVTCGSGWRPQFLLLKSISGPATSINWALYDSARTPSDPRNKVVFADKQEIEFSGTSFDVNFKSTGFAPYNLGVNNSGAKYIYLAIREPL